MEEERRKLGGIKLLNLTLTVKLCQIDYVDILSLMPG